MKEANTPMVITQLEAELTPEQGVKLVAAYRRLATVSKTANSPFQSYLLQPQTGGRWRIVSLWESAEKLQAMRATGETPLGVLIFREAGGEPTLTIFNVAAQVP